MIAIIVAMSENRVIGREGKIPWDLPEDRKKFQMLTMGNAIVMGRRTYDEIGHLLPGRMTYLLSGTKKVELENCHTVQSLEEVWEKEKNTGRDIFICGGAFEGLEKIIENRTDTKAIGFNSTLQEKKTEDVGAVLKQVLPQDFIKFGMIPELMGRVPVIVSLNPLDRDTLIRILQEPKNSIVKQYKKLFELDGVDLEFDDGAIEAIADKTLERKTGARGLRAIMEQAMMDLMYRIPSDDTIASCGVTKEVIEGTGEPILTHKEKTAAKPRGRRFKNGVEETA